MRVLYIQPWNTSSYEDVPRLRKSLDELVIPRALFEVALQLINAGASVNTLDCNLIALAQPGDPASAIESALAQKIIGTDAVFLSWPTVAQGNIVRHVAETIKRLAPTTPLLVGGGAVELVREDTYAHLPADIVYAGDGVEIPEILRAIETGVGLETIGGVFGKNGTHRPAIRRILDTYGAKDLYTMRGQFDFTAYLHEYRTLGMRPVGLLEMMRGCPHQCTYCAIRGSVAGVRYRDPKTVVDEAAFLVGHGVEKHYIIDPTFGLHQHKTEELLEYFTVLRTNNKDFQWWGITRCDRITESLAAKLKAAGAQAMSVGVETMSQTKLDDVHKHTRVDASRRALEILQNAGVTPRPLLMHFSDADDSETIRFLLRQKGKPVILQSSMMRPLYSIGRYAHETVTDFRRYDHEVDARSIGLDTDASVLGWLISNLAFPSTSVRRTGGDTALQKRLEQLNLELLFRAVNTETPSYFNRPERYAFGLLRVGYTEEEARARTQQMLRCSSGRAKTAIDSVIRALHAGVTTPRSSSENPWLAIVASTNPERWYYYPRPAQPFPQLCFNIKVGGHLEDLDQLILSTCNQKGGSSA